MLALLLTASADGGTLLHLGPKGLDLEPLGIRDAGPLQEKYLSWRELESALRDAGPLTIEIADEVPWAEVEKAGMQLGLAGRADVSVLAGTKAGFSFNLESNALPIVIEADEVWASLAAEGCSTCRTPSWRRGDPPRALAVTFAGRALTPDVRVFEHVTPKSRRQFDGRDDAVCRHAALRFKEVIAELETIHCASCRIGLGRFPTSEEVEASNKRWKEILDPLGPLGPLMRPARGKPRGR